RDQRYVGSFQCYDAGNCRQMPGVDTAVTHGARVGGSPVACTVYPAGVLERYTRNVPFAGRRRERQEIGRLLERAAGGAGGLLAITGPPGSGRRRWPSPPPRRP